MELGNEPVYFGLISGNTSLEEVVMTIHTHAGTYPVYHSIDTTQIYKSSQLITKKTGMMIQPNKAIVGANAFAHGTKVIIAESGIHQDGYLKNKSTYEIISPKLIGLPDKQLVLGKHSGRNAFNSRIKSLIKDTLYAEPLEKNPSCYESLFIAFKRLADSKKTGVNDEDLFALLDGELSIITGIQLYAFKSLTVVSGTGILSTATLTLVDLSKKAQASSKSSSENDSDYELVDAAIGQGPVHAIFNAINRLVGFKHILASYNVSAVTGGSDSLGLVTVKIRKSETDQKPCPVDISSDIYDNENSSSSGHIYTIGTGTDSDILKASAKAYINAVNKLLGSERRKVAMKTEDEINGDSKETLKTRNVDV